VASETASEVSVAPSRPVVGAREERGAILPSIHHDGCQVMAERRLQFPFWEEPRSVTSIHHSILLRYLSHRVLQRRKPSCPYPILGTGPGRRLSLSDSQLRTHHAVLCV
jgi:hypothetical protein